MKLLIHSIPGQQNNATVVKRVVNIQTIKAISSELVEAECCIFRLQFFLMKIDSNFHEVGSHWSNWPDASTGSDNGFSTPLVTGIR